MPKSAASNPSLKVEKNCANCIHWRVRHERGLAGVGTCENAGLLGMMERRARMDALNVDDVYYDLLNKRIKEAGFVALGDDGALLTAGHAVCHAHKPVAVGVEQHVLVGESAA